LISNKHYNMSDLLEDGDRGASNWRKLGVSCSMEGKKGILHPKLTGQWRGEPTWRATSANGRSWPDLDSSGTELDVFIVEGRNWAKRDSSGTNSAILPLKNYVLYWTKRKKNVVNKWDIEKCARSIDFCLGSNISFYPLFSWQLPLAVCVATEKLCAQQSRVRRDIWVISIT
jgi:hypothetical protein